MTVIEVHASIGQRLLWFLDRYRGAGGALNCPLLCRLTGELDGARLASALGAVLRRHDAVGSTFERRGRDLVQCIGDPIADPLRPVEVSAESLDAAIAEELATPIDPMETTVRVTLWRIGPTHHVLCVNMHHLVTDSWSCAVLFEDLCAALDDGLDAVDAGWSFAEFAGWQADALSGEPLAAERAYWSRKLAGMSFPELPFHAEADGLRRTGLERGELPEATVVALGAIARTRHTTLFAVLLTLYYDRLRSLTGQDDLTVASLFANRSQPQVRRTVGFLANMVLLRTELDRTWSFTRALAETTATVTEGLVHQGVPFQLLPIGSGTAAAGRPDDVVFQLLSDPIYRTDAGGLDIEVLVPDGVGSRFEFELVVVPNGTTLQTLLFYNQARMDEGFARDFLVGFTELADLVAVDPTITLDKTP